MFASKFAELVSESEYDCRELSFDSDDTYQALSIFREAGILKIEEEVNERVNSSWELVYKVSFKDDSVQYFENDGSYDSWSGTEFYNDWYEVKPVEVTKIEFVKV